MGKKWLSGAKLAKASGLSQNYLSKRLRDELSFTLNDIDKIAKALEIDPQVLVLAPLAGNAPPTTGTTRGRPRKTKATTTT
jgi:transcriptional regulator with XRE-family HTH domain